MHLPVLVIPAYNPDERLVNLLFTHQQKFANQHVIVINDGSLENCRFIFDKLKIMGFPVLDHDKNLGKGEALKTGMAYYLAHYQHTHEGIVTADADGQHCLDDIMRISREFMNASRHLHLGVRTLSEKKIPWRSRFGNTLTKHLFNRFTGHQITDTQTGLRGIPNELISQLLRSTTSRYEFEFEMLFLAKENDIPIIQTPIRSIYINNNEKSHFRPLLDSLKIYYIFIRFCSVSLISFGLDISLFYFFFSFSRQLGLSVFSARLISGSFNFLLNRQVTFKQNKQHVIPAALKYILLCTIFTTTSYSLLKLFTLLGINVYISKLLAELGMFMTGFLIQNTVIFKTAAEVPYCPEVDVVKQGKEYPQ